MVVHNAPDFLSPDQMLEVPELFKVTGQSDEEEKIDEELMMAKAMGGIKTKSDLLNHYFEVIVSQTPFRNFTLRFFARLLL